LACTEFDYYLFGIEGYARVTEVQLVRKRIASYMIKSGREELKGKRQFSVVLPKNLLGLKGVVKIPCSRIFINNKPLNELLSGENCNGLVDVQLETEEILLLIEDWYNTGVVGGVKEQDLRYLKPQATEFKAIIGMNAHALIDWFKIRCCMNAQDEISHLARRMLALCKEDNPVLFEKAGASCVGLGYCPENARINIKCKGRVLTHNEMLEILAVHGRR